MKTKVIAPGARVAIRDEEWRVRGVRSTGHGGLEVACVGLSELVRRQEKVFLTELDEIVELRPEETKLVDDPSPRYRRTRVWLEALLRDTPPTDDALYIGHRAAIDRASYQLQPAAKALKMPQPRILLADGVGLGKTIEVGILLSELIQRGRGQRILVVALKSILAQFQQELWARFTIPLVRLDSVGIQRVQSKIPSSMNPFYYFDRAIISIDTLKKEARYRTWLDQSHWDVIVIDECQNVAERTRGGSTQRSQRARLAQLLARTTDALILTSATPHDGSPESFASLIDLLDPTAIADASDYGPDDVSRLFVRRFKKDIAHEVGEAFHERDSRPVKATASAREDIVFRMLSKLEFRTIDRDRRKQGAESGGNRGVLFRTLLLKSLLSSPDAALATIDARLAHKDVLADNEDAAHDRAILEDLRTSTAAIGPSDFSKYNELLTLLRDARREDPKARFVIFSERIDTLEFLECRLKEDLKLKPKELEVFHGTLDDKTQTELVAGFGTEDSPIRVLLASDAASEGINLHYFCHRVIHFDLPWSFITLEQRNGRVDRYGQKERPILTYLLTVPGDAESKGDLRVLDLLIEKESKAHKNLGDVAWLMKLWDAVKEEEAIASVIQGDAKIEDVIPEDSSREVEPEIDLLQQLLVGSTDEPDVNVRDPIRLFADDLEYVHEVVPEVLGEDPDAIEWQEHAKGFVLRAPEDLQRALDHLPPELRENGDVFKLTSDRKRVMAALAATRKTPNRWPEWQLLWEQHPVMSWLDDRVLSSFSRHEAPVVRVARGVAVDERIVLFQGVLSNGRSQPVIVEWFGVRFKGTRAVRVTPLRDLLAETGLDGRAVNPGTPSSEMLRGHMEALLPSAVEAAKRHMAELRLARAEALGEPLREAARRIGRWRGARTKMIEERHAKGTEGGKALRKDEAARLDRERGRVAETYRQFDDFLKLGLRTGEDPYLRVAAVFVSRDAETEAR